MNKLLRQYILFVKLLLSFRFLVFGLIAIVITCCVTPVREDTHEPVQVAEKEIPETPNSKSVAHPTLKTGKATISTLFETFNAGRSGLEVDFFADYWGDKVKSVNGEIGITTDGGNDGSPCLKFDFQGDLDTENILDGWQDTDLTFYLNIHFTENPAEYDGVRLDINPRDFSDIVLFLRQEQGTTETFFHLPITLNANEWQELLIPFDNFFPLENGIELSELTIEKNLPITMSISVAFMDNYHNYSFREEAGMQGSVLVDNAGYYKLKGTEEALTLDNFEDEISRIVLSVGVYGSSTYMDYSDSIDGIERITPGIEMQRIVIRREAEGPFGNYVAIRAHLDINNDLKQWISDEQSLSFYVRCMIGKSWEDAKALSFSLRSRSLQYGLLELADAARDQYYYAEIQADAIWTKLIIPASELITEWSDDLQGDDLQGDELQGDDLQGDESQSDESQSDESQSDESQSDHLQVDDWEGSEGILERKSLANAESRPFYSVLNLTFDVPEDILLEGIEKRGVDIDLDLDEFILLSPGETDSDVP